MGCIFLVSGAVKSLIAYSVIFITQGPFVKISPPERFCRCRLRCRGRGGVDLCVGSVDAHLRVKVDFDRGYSSKVCGPWPAAWVSQTITSRRRCASCGHPDHATHRDESAGQPTMTLPNEREFPGTPTVPSVRDRITSDELPTSPLALLRSRGGEESHLPLDCRAAALRALDLACVQLRHVEKLSELFFTGLAAEDVLRHRNLHSAYSDEMGHRFRWNWGSVGAKRRWLRL